MMIDPILFKLHEALHLEGDAMTNYLASNDGNIVSSRG